MSTGYSTGYAMAEETTYNKVESDQRQMKKAKKPGMFARWLFKQLQGAAAAEKQETEYRDRDVVSIKQARGLQIGTASTPSIDQPDRAIQFTVYSANGGRIIETRRYDRKTDRNSNGLYIITNDQDFGRELDKIITMEHLK